MDCGPAPSPPLSGDPLGYPRGMLDDFIATLKKLQGYIHAHTDELHRREAATRISLINPLLRALGWDTSDIEQVRVEYPLNKGFADYVLMNTDGKPVILIEAKKLNAPLTDAFDQASQYCVYNRIPYFAVTDGQRWHLWRIRQHNIDQDVLLMELDILEDPSLVCIKALALWQPNVSAHRLLSIMAPKVQSSTMTSKEGANTGGWRPITTAFYLWRQTPSQLRLPDHSVRQISGFQDVLVGTTDWLVTEGHLTGDRLPVTDHHGKALIAATAPVPLMDSPKQSWTSAGSIFVNVPKEPATLAVRTCTIVRAAGLKPTDFAIHFSE